ncbi:MAG: CoA-binding protein [Candidatus Lokiarchaeota archaeon]|nr:CoA-binding protein [Candidatus Lokiarchaeota archaeon]
MSTEDIYLLYNPQSVAVIGASTTPLKGGYRILENLLENGFPPDKIYPVNPKMGTALGLEFYPSIEKIPHPVDTAIIFVPNTAIPEVLEQCIEKGIRGAIIQAAGFEEIGFNGLELKQKILKITNNFTKIRIVGPNCTGLTRVETDKTGFFSAFIRQFGYRRGNIGVISQSGMLNGGYFIYLSTRHGLKFRYIASIGNKMDLTENDFLEFFLRDPTVAIVACYLESFSDPRRFLALCKQANSIGKPVYLLRGGISRLGKKATRSHTGALAENSHLIRALIKQSHVIPATNFNQLFQFTQMRSLIIEAEDILPYNRNIAFITVSGGAGTIATDLIAKYQLNLPELENSTYQKMIDIYPDWMPPNHFSLLDIWPAVEKAKGNSNKVYEQVIDIILQDSKIEGLLISVFNIKEFPFNTRLLIKLHNRYHKPILAWVFGPASDISPVIQDLKDNCIPTFENLEEMVQNFASICTQKNFIQK